MSIAEHTPRKELRFHPLHGDGSRYPAALVPMRPVLRQWPVRRAPAEGGCRFLEGDGIFLSSGRAALATALRLLGCKDGDEVLVPAYHCGSMIEPILWTGARPVFFAVHEDLSADLGDLERRIGARTKALIFVHFFGFPHRVEPLASLAGDHGIALVEDCAHAALGSLEGKPLGSFGTYAIASAPKFFPVTDGGILVPGGGQTDVLRSRAPRLRSQIGSIAGALRNARRFSLSRLRSRLRRHEDQYPDPTVAVAPSRRPSTHPPDRFRWFDPGRVDLRGTWFSRMVVRRTPLASVASRRRENYLAIDSALRDVGRARPLFDALAPGVVPYVYPLLLDEPARDFPAIKYSGVPVLRWEEMVESSCAVSSDYRLRLIQVPCHQSLTSSELEWLTTRLASVLRSPGAKFVESR